MKGAIRRRALALGTILALIVPGWIALASPAQAMNGGWEDPVASLSVETGFMANDCGYPGYGGYGVADNYHIGIDYYAAANQAVYAIGDGVVVNNNANFGSGYGQAVFVRHTAYDGSQFIAMYGHVNGSSLAVGTNVTAGQQLTTVYPYTTGGAHLHFGIVPGTSYPSSNWGNLPCSSWPATNSFVNPATYLNDHPRTATGGSNTIIDLIRTQDAGGAKQVYAATSTSVTEGWWVPGGNGVHTSTIISKPGIVSIAKVNLPDGRQALYTAVDDGVWETWWGNGSPPSHSKIVTGRTGVKQVIADNRWEGSQYVHRLYILAQDGPFEAWWVDGGDGVHVNLLNAIAGGVTMTKATALNGADQLYVATPTWVYELEWGNGSGVAARAIINIPQADIRSLAKDNRSDGTEHLYTASSTTVWRTTITDSTVSHEAFVPGQTDIRKIKKTAGGGADQLYVATSTHVQEYWWHATGSGGGTIMNQSGIATMDKVSDGAEQLYTAAGNTVRETWWGGGNSPTTNVLFTVN